jgi:hypothetical protein
LRADVKGDVERPQFQWTGSVTSKELFMQTPLTGDELRNFRHFDLGKALQGDGGAVLLNRILALVGANERRERALQPRAAQARELTASALLANLASAALNRQDDTKFIAVRFDRNFYAKQSLSVEAMCLLRDELLVQGLIEGRPGGRRVNVHDASFGWLTRLRATRALRALFVECGISYASIKQAACQNVLVLRLPQASVSQEPPIDVEMTREVVEGVNRRIAAAHIRLPDDAWGRITSNRLDALAGAMELDAEDRASAGDEERTSLVRLFKFDWSHGGRLYGGWWIGLPKEERKLLTIDGEAVVELDYGQLHPSILYARIGEQMEGDPYTVGEWASPAMRQLGKTTFARMLNTTTNSGEARAIRIKGGDADKLPPGLTWSRYLAALQSKLTEISHWFWIGEGLRLQREDSDLAISVLKALNEQDVIVLPVHDSFIVQAKNRSLLRVVMNRAYRDKFYYHPVIR